MTKTIVVLTTAGGLREARSIARRLVEARLAACVNISSPLRSVYRWNGKVVEEREFLLFIKTRREHFRKLRDAILQIHSYTTPEIIAIPVTAGSREYLRWVDESTQGGGDGKPRIALRHRTSPEPAVPAKAHKTRPPLSRG